MLLEYGSFYHLVRALLQLFIKMRGNILEGYIYIRNWAPEGPMLKKGQKAYERVPNLVQGVCVSGGKGVCKGGDSFYGEGNTESIVLGPQTRAKLNVNQKTRGVGPSNKNSRSFLFKNCQSQTTLVFHLLSLVSYTMVVNLVKRYFVNAL